MKKTVIIGAVASLALFCHAEKAVRVTSAEGEASQYLLADCPTVKYIAEGLQITAGETSVVLPAEQAYTFTIVEASGIADAATSQVSISRNADVVTISGLTQGAIATAHTVDGKQVARAAAAAGTAQLDLSAARGILIIQTPSQTFKLIK